MEQRNICIQENGIYVDIEVSAEGEVCLHHLAPVPAGKQLVDSNVTPRTRSLVALQATGEDQDDHHGSKYTGTMPGSRLTYASHQDYRNEMGRKLELSLSDGNTLATVHYQFYDAVSVIRAWTTVENVGEEALPLEYVSSIVLPGISRSGAGHWDAKSRLHIAHQTWHGELQWRNHSLPELGLTNANAFSIKRLAYSRSGTWSSSELLPMGAYENKTAGQVYCWQIETSGSWHWEISDHAESELYVQLSGPTENENHWWKRLAPGESFQSVPVAVAIVNGGVEAAFQQLTLYRRAIRRPNRDNEQLPVIFNDYMNCLFADPTTEKTLPLVDAAAAAGCEYYCIDAGWYADGEWWSEVGLWQPSQQRFPGGLQEVLDYIRAKGMVPGLWLELEVMGIHCPLASDVSDNWFFMRHGKRVIDHGRFQLDYRNPDVVRYADEVIDRLVAEYKVGYIKMDYNINAGIGTEEDADSFGDGLLQHNRAYLAWLDRVFERYPDLVIENCGSGGMRMDYALLARHSVQSLSDQTDYRKFAAISAASATAVTPEQAAAWAYPLAEGDEEEVIFNMVNCLLLRVHQSGHLAALAPARFELVREGIAYYKTIRQWIPRALPFWPLGLPKYGDEWVSIGLRSEDRNWIAVWRLGGDTETAELLLPDLKGKALTPHCAYPERGGGSWDWNAESGVVTVSLLQPYTARIIELRPGSAT